MSQHPFVVRGVIHTLCEEQPDAQAFAVAGGRVIAVGSLEQARAAAGPDAAVLDYGDAAILPGLIDAHNHHAVAGDEDLFQLSFPATATIDQIVQAVADHQASLPDGEWVVGGLWGSDLVAQLSTSGPLAALDAVTGERPVILTDDSHHNKWANSAALRLSGILARTGDPAGGKILRDADGAPTGLLLESAGAIVEQHRLSTLRRDDEYHARCSERGIEMLAEHGIVAFQDAAASIDTLAALKKLDDEGRLKAWAVSSMLINDTIFGNEQVGEALLPLGPQYATAHHRPTWSKIFLDGVPPTRTGAFLEPYRPDDEHGADHRGSTTMSPDELEGWLRTAADLGIGIKIHCTGDAAVRLVLDTVTRVRADGVGAPVQIAHGQFVHSDDLARFGPLGVVAEISPFLWYPGVIPQAIHDCLPDHLADHMQPNRSLLDAGATVVVGSDWPVSETPNPWHAVFGLVTRSDPTGRFPGTLWSEQAISREEAIRCVTSASADAMGLGDVTGRIRAGNSADFVVLDRDPFHVDVEALAGTRAVETWFAGTQVYARH